MSAAPQTNYAFIDSQNLNLSIQNLGWKLDYARFRRYLQDKYNVSRAIIFIGYMEEQSDLYSHLQAAGYELVYKPTLSYKDGSTKGNVDAELVMHTIIELPNYHQAVIVTGDGDFYSLIEYLIDQGKLAKLVIPSQYRYSALLKQFDPQYLAFVSDLRQKLEYTHKRRNPESNAAADDTETPTQQQPQRSTRIDTVQGDSEARNEPYTDVRRASTGANDAEMRSPRTAFSRKEPQPDHPDKGAFLGDSKNHHIT